MKPKDVMPISVALMVIVLVPSGLGLLLAMVLGVACSLMMHGTSTRL